MNKDSYFPVFDDSLAFSRLRHFLPLRMWRPLVKLASQHPSGGLSCVCRRERKNCARASSVAVFVSCLLQGIRHMLPELQRMSLL